MLMQLVMGAAAAQRFTFSESSLRVAREPCFAQTARGPGLLGKMFSATLAIANAVQFSVCSGVLRVLGLARADPSGVCSQSAVEGAKPSAQNSQIWLFSRRNGQTTSGLEVGTGPLGRNVAAPLYRYVIRCLGW